MPGFTSLRGIMIISSSGRRAWKDQQFLDGLLRRRGSMSKLGVDSSRKWRFEAIPIFHISIQLEHEEDLIELSSKLKAHIERVGEGNI